MNKDFYRVIFNKARGMLMVVAEIASSSGSKTKTNKRVKQVSDKAIFAKLKPISFLTYALLGYVTVSLPAQANDIVVDPNAHKGQQPTVIQSANGTTQINIQTPGKGGVSHNKFTQFDVSDKGVILNNSHKSSLTELGGYIKGNEFLTTTGGASIILNEVNSRNPSQLSGYIEVAGQRAQVIIANAAGITCNGCGFINANRATLTTGQPIIENGQLKGYQVEQGHIGINGKGMDTSRQDYTDLIAKTVSLNASLHARDLNVVTGRNRVSHDTYQVDKLADDNTEKPQLAIDVSALGGMYAGKIRLVGTEVGVGVHNAGVIGASAGSVVITADGRIENNGAIQASQNIKLNSAHSITNNKQIYAKDSVNLTANDNILNTGSIVAQHDIQLSAKTLESTGNSTVAAGIDEQGKLTQSGNIIAKADSITLQGQNLAHDNIDLQGVTANLSHSQTAAGNIQVKANVINTQQAILKSSNDIKLDAIQLIDNHSARLIAGNHIHLQAGEIDNSQVLMISEEDITLVGDRSLNNQQTQLMAKGNISLSTQGELNNEQAELVANKDISLTAQTLNNQSATVKTQQQLSVSADDINNRQAELLADNIKIQTALIDNSNAKVTAQHQLEISAEDITNTDAKLLADDIQIVTDSLTGDGILLSTGDITLTMNQSFTNTGELMANGNLNVTTEQDIVNQNKIIAGQSITLGSNKLTNNNGAEISADRVTLNHQTITNQGLIDGGQMNIAAIILNNLANGRIYADNLSIKAQTLNNLAENGVAPVIAARENLHIGVTTLNNKGHGLITSLGALNIGGSLDEQGRITGQADTINNHSSRIESSGNMVINVNTLNNVNDNIQTELQKVSETQYSKYCHDNTTVCYLESEVRFNHIKTNRKNYLQLVTPDGQVAHDYHGYKYVETVYQTKVIHSEPGEIIAGGNLVITGDSINNYDSHIIAGNALVMNAALNNVQTEGIEQRVINGTHTRYYRHVSKRGDGKKKYSGRTKHNAYNPADSIVAIDLESSHIVEHQVVSNNTQIDDNRQSADVQPSDERVDVTETISAEGHMVSTVSPNTTLPDNSLFEVNKDPDSDYLIETDSRFTNKKEWLGSDYMLNQLKQDPDNIRKRLGDGYYEQKLIREQITALTGQRYLGDYRNDMDQYKALMDAGIEFANSYNLIIGVALTADQMKALTTDIVWMVSKTVTIDGVDHEVLVPQVYLINRPSVSAAGALVSGHQVQVSTDKDINNSGTIVAKDRLNLFADNINNQGVLSADSLVLQANTDINHSGSILGDKLVSLSAGNNINLVSTTHTETNNHGLEENSKTVVDRVASVQVKNGDLSIKAENDLNLSAALIANMSEEGKTVLQAGNDINLTTVQTRDKEQSIQDSNNYRKTDVQKAVGTEIYGVGDVALIAGNTLSAEAARVTSENGLSLTAKDIVISTATETDNLSANSKTTSKGFMSKSTTVSHHELDDATQKGSQFSGNTITMKAENDVTINGSQVLGTQDVNVQAGNDVNITAAEESYYSQSQTVTTKSGLISSGGIGLTVGSMKEDLKQTDTEKSYLGSTIGSTEGSVNITAGRDVSIKGSDVIAQKDIAVQGENINIESLDATTRYEERYEMEKTGVTVALTGTAADVYEAVQAVRRAKEGDNDKLVALQSIKAGLTAIQAIEDSQLKNKQGESQASIGISIMGGTQRTEREVNQEQHSVVGSGLSAGDNITLTATGNAAKEGGNITIKGSEVKAGNDININALGDLNVLGDVNTQHSDRDEKSYGGNVGIGLSFGGDESGLRYKGNANFSRERENADGSAWTESIIDAGNKLTINTGKDVNVIGGQLKGDTVVADIGNNLNIQSLQDTDNYDYEKLTASIEGSAGTGGSLNVSLSQTEIESKWASVTDQSGIFAGDGGFDIRVENNTDLKGAVIASDADDKTNNKLDTGTISFEDIENKANFNVEHVSVSAGTGGVNLNLYKNKDSDSSTTQSAVEEGELIVRNEDEQKQNTNDLSRDTANANDALGQIFDKQKELDRMETVELIKDIGKQASSVISKAQQIEAQKQVADSGYPKQTDIDSKKKALEEENKNNPNYTLPSDDQIKSGLFYDKVQDVYNKDSGHQSGMGGSITKGIESAVSIVTGVLTGDITGGVAGALAPHLAGVIKEKTKDNDEANFIAHTILGAVVAELQGNSGLAGGLGALTGEIAAGKIKDALFPDKEISELSQSDKDKISGLAQLVAGLAGALAGQGDVADIGTAVAGGKNAVENNALTTKQDAENREKEVASCNGNAACKTDVNQKWIDEAIRRDQEVNDCNTAQSCLALFKEYTDKLQNEGSLSDYYNDKAELTGSMTDKLVALTADDTYKNSLLELANKVSYLGDATPEMLAEVGAYKDKIAATIGIGAAAGLGSSKQPNATNPANSQKLKDQLASQNLSNISWSDPRLAKAVQGDGTGKVNFGVGSGSRAEADRLGMLWVGDGARQTSNGGWISADGNRTYRPPSNKPNSSHATTGTQANFEQKSNGVVISNGHLDIND